jgi:hypothetical protein
VIGNAPIQIFSIFFGNGVILSSFLMDFDPLPFTAGYVKGETADSMTPL